MSDPNVTTILKTWALVPIKPPVLAKTRLSGLLTGSERARLQWAMLQDVLDQLCKARRLCGVAIVSPDRQVRQMAQARGMLAIGDEPEGGDLNAALHRGTERLRKMGADLIVILPGDVPLIDAVEIDRAIELAIRENTAVVVPDRNHDGTNGLVFWTDRVPKFQFGKNSYQRHLRETRRYGTTVLWLGSLALDIDCVADLDCLRKRRRNGMALNTSCILNGLLAREVLQPLDKDS